MRTRSSGTADDLREHAMDGIGMDEGHLQAEQPALRPLVDQLRALGLELVERRADVIDLVRDVVHPGAPLGEELADGRVVTEGGEQLDPARAHAQRSRLDPLAGHRPPVADARPHDPPLGSDGAVEIVDCDAKVMNSVRLHAAAMLPGHSAATTRTVPTVSAEAPLAVLSGGRAGLGARVRTNGAVLGGYDSNRS